MLLIIVTSTEMLMFLTELVTKTMELFMVQLLRTFMGGSYFGCTDPYAENYNADATDDEVVLRYP